MEGALSFARRALACKEDTKLLALCAQVTSRLKELSQLKWDIHETEKIEIIAVKWTPANVSAGKVYTHSTPTIDIEPIDMPSTFKPGERVTFQVTTAFTSTLKNFQPGEDHKATVSCILVSDENTSSTPMREGGLHYSLSHYLMTSYPVF